MSSFLSDVLFGRPSENTKVKLGATFFLKNLTPNYNTSHNSLKIKVNAIKYEAYFIDIRTLLHQTSNLTSSGDIQERRQHIAHHRILRRTIQADDKYLTFGFIKLHIIILTTPRITNRKRHQTKSRTEFRIFIWCLSLGHPV